MTPSDFTEKEFLKFLHQKIINPNPDVFTDKERQKKLIHIANYLRLIEGEYFKLLSIVKSDEEVARLFFEHHDWLPVLKAANGTLQHLFDTEHQHLRLRLPAGKT